MVRDKHIRRRRRRTTPLWGRVSGVQVLHEEVSCRVRESPLGNNMFVWQWPFSLVITEVIIKAYVSGVLVRTSDITLAFG